MAKKVTPAQAKAAKQKKIAIGLGILLVGVAAIQGPKMLKMMKGPAAPVAAAPAATTPAPTGTPAAPTAVAPAGSPPDAGQPAVLASSDTAGQLLSFELFESKDPFTQQVDASVQTPSATAAKPQQTVPATGTTPASSGSAVPGAASGTGATTPATPFAPVAEPAAATTISVNDVSGPAEVGKEFPTDDPIFMLVSTASDGKSVQIGIAGGSYANGEQTITLKLGKPLTLQNTADGTRYELVLETVAGFAPPKAKK
jgi:hypothetical protein